MKKVAPGMKRWIVLWVVLSVAGIPAAADSPQYLLDLDSGRRVALAEVASKVAGNTIVVVGEQHTEEAHHRAQLRVIQALEAAGARVAIGLEMFRHDSQADLDRWTAGEIAPADFQKIYSDNWNYPWEVYRPIFEHARNRRIPMVGLNVPRDITRQVARSGFASLSEEQRGRLSDVTCSIDAEYMRYIRSVYGAHAHGNMSFEFFCEAQMVWDTAMAVHALGFLSAHPDAVVVILTGVGHAQKGAVPRQILLRSQVPVTAMLPEVPGSIDAGTVGRQDADYLLLDLHQ